METDHHELCIQCGVEPNHPFALQGCVHALSRHPERTPAIIRSISPDLRQTLIEVGSVMLAEWQEALEMAQTGVIIQPVDSTGRPVTLPNNTETEQQVEQLTQLMAQLTAKGLR